MPSSPSLPTPQCGHLGYLDNSRAPLLANSSPPRFPSPPLPAARPGQATPLRLREAVRGFQRQRGQDGPGEWRAVPKAMKVNEGERCD